MNALECLDIRNRYLQCDGAKMLLALSTLDGQIRCVNVSRNSEQIVIERVKLAQVCERVEIDGNVLARLELESAVGT